MRFKELRLEGFRNFALASLPLEAPRVFLLGENGQGKTNLLEALGLVTALRSFRTQERAVLVRRGSPQARLVHVVEHERRGLTTIETAFDSRMRSLSHDGTRVTRLADHMGQFPTVTLSSLDSQLLRGAPALRRRFLDLSLSGVSAPYLRSLTRFHSALESRNRLLRSGQAGQIPAFTQSLAEEASLLAAARREAVAELSAGLERAYAAVADAAESPSLSLEEDLPAGAPSDYLRFWEGNLERDLLLRSTQRGPHRDDLDLRLFGQPSRDFASEGQQRALVLALRLAQLRWSAARTGLQPVLLCDDVLGELDGVRRARFWQALDPAWQIVATGTRAPVEAGWAVTRVAAGGLAGP